MAAKKNILLISPQPWGKLHISKHHYAIALAELGNQVFFLNPPDKKEKNFRITPSDYKDIMIVDGGFRDSLILRYHLAWLYRYKVRNWIGRLIKKLPPIDIVWCFETNILSDLRPFKNAVKIFHVVDPVNAAAVITARTADMLICVSHRILEQFTAACVPIKKVINHALSDIAVKQAQELDLKNYIPGSPVKVGYIGNLYRKIIDTPLLLELIKDNPETAFHFWGPGTNKEKNNLGDESQSLASGIEELPNVFLHSSIPSEDLVRTISDMDMFILAYKKIMPHYDASNSHKVLEYLATGKMLVTSYLDEYNHSDFSRMMQMSPDGDNEALLSIFKEVVTNIRQWNNYDNMEARRSFAIRHTYKNNAISILTKLTELIPTTRTYEKG